MVDSSVQASIRTTERRDVTMIRGRKEQALPRFLALRFPLNLMTRLILILFPECHNVVSKTVGRAPLLVTLNTFLQSAR